MVLDKPAISIDGEMDIPFSVMIKEFEFTAS